MYLFTFLLSEEAPVKLLYALSRPSVLLFPSPNTNPFIVLAICSWLFVLPNLSPPLLEIDTEEFFTFVSIPFANSIALSFVTLLVSFDSILYDVSITMAI